jgi:hypothetical protein
MNQTKTRRLCWQPQQPQGQCESRRCQRRLGKPRKKAIIAKKGNDVASDPNSPPATSATPALQLGALLGQIPKLIVAVAI